MLLSGQDKNRISKIQKSDEQTPLISVVVPVYNVLPYLDRCIQSIVDQTYPSLELVLIDDGSTDGSGERCDIWAARLQNTAAPFPIRSVTLIHQNHKGVAAARNTGIASMHGDYISFLDADDYLHPEMIQRLYDAIRKDGSDLALCQYDTEVRKYRYKIGIKEGIYTGKDTLFILLSDNQLISYTLWNKLYPVKLLPCLCFPEGCNYEDAEVIVRILKRVDTVSVLTERLYYHTIRHGSITNTYTVRNIKDLIRSVNVRESMMLDCIPEKHSIIQALTTRSYLRCWYRLQMLHDSEQTALSAALQIQILKRKQDLPLLDLKGKVLFLMLIYTPRIGKWLFSIKERFISFFLSCTARPSD